jgi:hypothetical protein
MTPERLKDVIEQCLRLRRREDRPIFYADFARFLGVQPITMRRWLRGERPVPRMAEIIFEIFHHWPEISPEAVDNAIAKRDKALASQKQH